VIDSLKDTQLCQNICTSFVFTSFGFFSSHSDRCEFYLRATGYCMTQGLHIFICSKITTTIKYDENNDSCLMESQKRDAES
jgi:hypothetical protein